MCVAESFVVSVQVPMERLAELLTSVLWSVTDEELKLLNGVLIAVSNDGDEGVQLVEFVVRVPLEISERVCDALVNGPPKRPVPDNADEGEFVGNEAASDEQQPVPDDVLAFDSVDDRAEARSARVKEEMDDVIRAARLATAFPRTVDDDCFDECPEADREATQLRDLVGRLAEMAPERPDWIAEVRNQWLSCTCFVIKRQPTCFHNMTVFSFPACSPTYFGTDRNCLSFMLTLIFCWHCLGALSSATIQTMKMKTFSRRPECFVKLSSGVPRYALSC